MVLFSNREPTCASVDKGKSGKNEVVFHCRKIKSHESYPHNAGKQPSWLMFIYYTIVFLSTGTLGNGKNILSLRVFKGKYGYLHF